MIQTTEETRQGWLVVTVSGRADAAAADALELALRSAINSSERVAADLATLDYISSAGLRALLQAGRAAQSRGSEFAVCRANEMVRKVFEISGFDRVLRIQGELPC